MTTMNDDPRSSDPILDELHAIRRRMHDECGGDLNELVARIRERESRSDHPLASVPVRRSQATRECTKAADPA